MKVRKSAKRSQPGYPTLRQLDRRVTWVGVAAIGLGAMTGLAESGRLMGVMRSPDKPATGSNVTASCTTSTPVTAREDVRLPGDVAVVPRTLGAPRPAQGNATNRPAVVPPPSTNAAVRLKGEMPAK